MQDYDATISSATGEPVAQIFLDTVGEKGAIVLMVCIPHLDRRRNWRANENIDHHHWCNVLLWDILDHVKLADDVRVCP
jgi:hypothetical protein